MDYPTTALITLESEGDRHVLMTALNQLANDLASPLAARAAVLSKRVAYHPGDPCTLPEAYLTVDGVRKAEGRRDDVSVAFTNEVSAHTATVLMFARAVNSTEYKQVRSRRPVERYPV